MNFILLQQEKFDQIVSKIDQINARLHASPPAENNPAWLLKKEACKKLQVCSKTLDSYLKKGTIPFTQFKSKIYIKASDIEAHLEKYYVTKN